MNSQSQQSLPLSARVNKVLKEVEKSKNIKNSYTIASDAQKLLEEYIAEISTSILEDSCLLAKHRGSNVVDPYDVNFMLMCFTIEKKFGIGLALPARSGGTQKQEIVNDVSNPTAASFGIIDSNSFRSDGNKTASVVNNPTMVGNYGGTIRRSYGYGTSNNVAYPAPVKPTMPQQPITSTLGTNANMLNMNNTSTGVSGNKRKFDQSGGNFDQK